MKRPIPEGVTGNYPEIPDSSEDPRYGAIRVLVQRWREEASSASESQWAEGIWDKASMILDELEDALGSENSSS
jgi:hypothetical protein